MINLEILGLQNSWILENKMTHIILVPLLLNKD